MSCSPRRSKSDMHRTVSASLGALASECRTMLTKSNWWGCHSCHPLRSSRRPHLRHLPNTHDQSSLFLFISQPDCCPPRLPTNSDQLTDGHADERKKARSIKPKRNKNDASVGRSAATAVIESFVFVLLSSISTRKPVRVCCVLWQPPLAYCSPIRFCRVSLLKAFHTR